MQDWVTGDQTQWENCDRCDSTQFNMPECPFNSVCSRNAGRKYIGGGDNGGVPDMLI